MADGKYIPVYYEADGTTKNAFLVRDLDEKMIKELRLDEVMSFYDQCLKDNGFLRESAKAQKVTVGQMRDLINEQVCFINDCCLPIFERRQRVSTFFGRLKPDLLSTGRMTDSGKLCEIGWDIPDDIFDDLYHLLADAICCRFQYNQYDGKFRNGMFHVLQWLDGKFWANDYGKQYPNATEDEKYRLNRTRILDLITGRDNENFEVYGETYRCSAFLADDGLFRLHIDEVLPWNISNAPKEEFNRDCKSHKLWSVDKRYEVRLDATQMAYYVFIYENPDMTVSAMAQRQDALKKCLNDCCSGSKELLVLVDKYVKATNESVQKKVLKDIEVKFKKRVCDINKKVIPMLGEAYSIVSHEDGSYDVPISKDMIERPEV